MDVAWSYWDSAKEQYKWSTDNGDPRVADWPLMQSPLPSLLCCFAYLVVCYAGPRLMAKRRAFELQPLLILYNLAMVILSLYMFLEFFISTWKLNFNYYCDLVVYSTDENSMRLASVIWLFYVSKIVEFLDTFFFILRKKNSQITVLHIYHHSTMVALWWIGTKWYAGGASFFSAMVNCFIHTIMYSYYLLSAMGPAVRPYLWWKKYLTMIQLAQFALILLHVSYALYTGCRYDHRPQWALVVYMLSHLALFANFYVHAYGKSGRRGGRGEGRRGGEKGGRGGGGRGRGGEDRGLSIQRERGDGGRNSTASNEDLCATDTKKRQ